MSPVAKNIVVFWIGTALHLGAVAQVSSGGAHWSAPKSQHPPTITKEGLNFENGNAKTDASLKDVIKTWEGQNQQPTEPSGPSTCVTNPSNCQTAPRASSKKNGIEAFENGDTESDALLSDIIKTSAPGQNQQPSDPNNPNTCLSNPKNCQTAPKPE
ncbi:hypothetical protein AWB67_02282 [Caballeronia terrestris]|uniref:Uncharacterized protein n=2 Tax=Caballeronia terrestris TaxID=1226301 RepID=A0A158I1I6_9BURK|nr:hypothetical protein AWB67_02282 [Caballeronia terrestris]